MLKKNIALNYASQIYLAALNILIIPVYLKLLGAETYGLIGTFIMAQSLMQAVDMGLSATLSREATKFNVNPETAPIFRYVFDKVLKFFLGISIFVTLLFLVLAQFYALDWFKYKSLEPQEVLLSVSLIIVIVSLRFLVGPLRSILLGLEKHTWLNTVIIITGSLKYLGIIPIIMFVSKTPRTFFIYELCIAIIEALLISIYTFKLIPKKSPIDSDATAQSISHLIKFSLGAGFTYVIWILASQIDRVVLSKSLPLDQYGHFSAVVVVAGGIMILSSPLSRALLPRMTALVQSKNIEALMSLYRKSTRLIAFVVVPVGIIIMGFSAEFLWLWTGNKELASYGKIVLFWYAYGNTAMALAAFPYYMQYAFGELKLHVIGNTLYFLIGIPLISALAFQKGALGTGVGWALLQTAYLLLATYFTHRKYLPVKSWHWRWLSLDVLPGYLVSGSIVFFVKATDFITTDMDRITVFIKLSLVSTFVFACCYVANKLITKLS